MGRSTELYPQDGGQRSRHLRKPYFIDVAEVMPKQKKGVDG
jgi:hypothetical protein